MRAVQDPVRPSGFCVAGIKVLDFGLATGMTTADQTEATISVTGPGLVAGTVPYMSPEQVRGETVDARSDIWAAGAVLYEMATGQRPFPEKNGPALIGAILHRAPQSPRELNPDISAGLESIIVRALEKQPAQRFQSAREIQAALEQVQLATQSLSGVRRVDPPPRPRSQALRWLMVTFALAVLLAAGFLARRYWMPADTGMPGAGHVLVLVGDLENRTGESVFDHTLQELLRTGIEQSRTVSVFPASRLRDALGRMQRSPTTAISEVIGREVCQREGLHAVIVGSIAKLGTSYVMIARAVSPAGISLASEQRTAGHAGEVPAQLDVIIQRLRTGLGESLSSVEATSAPLAQVTSASLDAVRYFTLGKQRLDAADAAEAVSWFEKAVALDHAFAMARGYLGIAYQNLNRLDRAEEELAAAALLLDRVTETERLKILGDYNLLIGDYEAGCNAFAALSRLKPEDPAPFHGLGICHARRREYDEGLAANEKALALLPAIPTRYNSARIYLFKGDLDRARERAESVLRDVPSNINARRIVGRVYELRGETSEAARWFEEMIAAGSGGLVSGRAALADLYLATGRFRNTRPLLDAQVAAADARGDVVAAARARIMLAEWLAENGQRQQAAQLLSTIGQSPRDPAIIMRLGRAYARMGQPAEAQKILAVMQAVTAAKPNPHLRSLEGILAAALAAAEGRKADAVKHAENAATLEPSVLAVDELARAYDGAGRLTEAVKSYGEVLARAAERADLDDDASFRRVVDIHYRLGVLLQDASRPGEARPHLETFLRFWSDADPTLAIKRDAIARMRRLAQAQRTAAGTPTPAT